MTISVQPKSISPSPLFLTYANENYQRQRARLVRRLDPNIQAITVTPTTPFRTKILRAHQIANRAANLAPDIDPPNVETTIAPATGLQRSIADTLTRMRRTTDINELLEHQTTLLNTVSQLHTTTHSLRTNLRTATSSNTITTVSDNVRGILRCLSDILDNKIRLLTWKRPHLHIVTNDITIANTNIGPFELIINLHYGVRANNHLAHNALRIIPAAHHPGYYHPDPTVIHPHIRWNDICMGALQQPLVQSLQRLDIGTTIELVLNFLSTYNADSPFTQLRYFEPRGRLYASSHFDHEHEGEDPCRHCEDDTCTTWQCFDCGSSVCEECGCRLEDVFTAWFCPDCTHSTRIGPDAPYSTRQPALYHLWNIQSEFHHYHPDPDSLFPFKISGEQSAPMELLIQLFPRLCLSAINAQQRATILTTLAQLPPIPSRQHIFSLKPHAPIVAQSATPF